MEHVARGVTYSFFHPGYYESSLIRRVFGTE
jgi:hypothetical protein